MLLPVKTGTGSYDILLARGALAQAGDFFKLDRRVLIVTDSGVPKAYCDALARACRQPVIVVIEQGESSKQLPVLTQLLQALVENRFTRTDCVVAVGGGVVGDLAGFASAIYLRGIDFYNVPTTLLSQVDSSIGGKTAIDFMGLKNLVGAFYPPCGVLIDPETLATLPPRQLSNGMAEAIKMAATSDAALFHLFETEDLHQEEILDTVIERSLLIKRSVVEQDEKEAGLRKILNFGHTLAHAIESAHAMQDYYHGECVALGMLPMCSEAVRRRLLPVLEKLKLPTQLTGKADTLIRACRHDKKLAGDAITIVYVPEVGSYELRTVAFGELEAKIRQVLAE